MSSAASDLALPGAPGEATPPGEPASDAAPAPPDALVEHDGDLYETRLEYDPKGGFPFLVIAVWVAALVGLGVYVAAFLFPDFAQWGKP